MQVGVIVVPVDAHEAARLVLKDHLHVLLLIWLNRVELGEVFLRARTVGQDSPRLLKLVLQAVPDDVLDEAWVILELVLLRQHTVASHGKRHPKPDCVGIDRVGLVEHLALDEL